MSTFQALFSKYTGILRSLKPVYVINNLINRKKLAHNRALYQEYGIRKSIFGPIGSQDLENITQDGPWLDQANAMEQLLAHPDYANFSEEIQAQLRQFVEKGYMILKGFYSDEEVDRLNEEVDRMLSDGKTDFNYSGKKMMDAHRKSTLIDQGFFRQRRLLNILNFVMGKKVVPFQTINFIEGSEQRAHSDSIHMTTAPLGYLVAAWTALEDLHEGNGPLFYFPETHRMPYVTCQDYLSGNTKWQLGSNSYKAYEDKIEAIIEEQDLEKISFLGKKGDVFIWHANLLHGGSPITKAGTTRRSMVAHYFCEGVICYHEISQRPALID